ncbi:hypothetical protein TNCV_782461 [Trichonephila clavipes]|nr:hypothetical protein TNCV_782461 [Trichonephila clavipes]
MEQSTILPHKKLKGSDAPDLTIDDSVAASMNVLPHAIEQQNAHFRWRKGDERRRRKGVGRGREEPALDEEKGLVRDWSGKTMNAGGVENGI